MKLASSHVSSDLFLILTSVAIAFVVWLIAKEGELGQESFNVPVHLRNVPANIEATLPFNSVRLLTSEPKSVGAQLRADCFSVELDWDRLANPRTWCGTRKPEPSPAVPLDPSLVVLSGQINEDLKQQIRRSVQYLEIQPGRLSVQGRYVTRPARIVVKTRNNVAEGYELDGPIAVTDSRDVLLTAPPTRFAELGAKGPDDPVEVQTKEIDLADRRETRPETVPLVLPEGVELASGEDARIEVRVPVKAKVITRTLENVPLVITTQNKNLDAQYTERTAEVTVRGPEETVQSLKAADLVVHPAGALNEEAGKDATVKLTANLVDTIPDDVRSAITVLSTKPPSVKLKFEPRVPVRLPDLNKPDSTNP